MREAEVEGTSFEPTQLGYTVGGLGPAKNGEFQALSLKLEGFSTGRLMCGNFPAHIALKMNNMAGKGRKMRVIFSPVNSFESVRYARKRRNTRGKNIHRQAGMLLKSK
jgi:hypothetical protein